MGTTVYRIYSPTLIPNSNLFYWKDRLLHLPGNVKDTSSEFKKGFMKVLKSVEEFSMKRLSPEEKEIASQKAWEEISKIIPGTDYTRPILLMIQIAGAAFLLMIGLRACL
jgi:hypothetical protein